MNNPNQPAIRLSTQSDQYSVSPGDKIEIPLVLTNVGAVADQARISIEGIPLIWVTAEQQVILLQPGEQRQVILTIQPPAPPTPEPA